MPTECLDRDIEITPVDGTVTVYHNERPLASSDAALALREESHPVRYYLPRGDVPGELLSQSENTSHCPFKGDASYHHLRVDGETLENAVWYYPDPCPLAEPVRDHLSFWGDGIRVEAPGR